jgi:ATP-dependent helicase/DNAse subunit B
MEINYLRASSIGTYKDCQFKYFLDYTCGLQSPAGKKALLGTIFHWIYEALARCKKTGHYKLNDKYSDPNYLLQVAWARFTKENPQFEYTKADWKFVHKLVNEMMHSKLNPLKLDILATEKQFEIDLDLPGFGENCKLRGTIDLVTKLDDETLHVVDWKSGERKDWVTGKPKELDDFQKDIQLRVYDLALRVLYPEYKYRLFTIYYVRDGGPYTVTFSNKDVAESIDAIRKYYNQIKTNNKPKRIKDDRTRSREFFKCKFVCHYGKTKDDNGNVLCDKFFKLTKNEKIENAQQKIYNLTRNGEAIEASRRNDYSHSKITKGKISDISTRSSQPIQHS